MENHAKESSAASVAPPQAEEELLKKLQELETGHAQLKQEMSKLMNSQHSTIHHNYNQRPHSISPQRVPWRRAGGGDGGLVAAWKRTSASYWHSSPLHRESSSKDEHSGGAGGRQGALNLTDK